MRDKNFMLFDSEPAYETVKELMEDEPSLTEDNAWQMAYDAIRDDRNFLLSEFRDVAEGNYVMLTERQTWNGKSKGMVILYEKDLGEVLEPMTAALERCDSSVRVWLTPERDIVAEKVHHDGTNTYMLRKVRARVSERTIENLGIALSCGCDITEKIMKYTIPAGKPIAKHYGLH